MDHTKTPMMGHDMSCEDYMKIMEPYTFPCNVPTALELMKKACEDEKADILLIECLMAMAPCKEDKALLKEICDSERRNMELLKTVYHQLTCEELNFKGRVRFRKPCSYCQGIKRGLKDEIHSITVYRQILYALQCPTHINMITDVLTNEMRNASLFQYLYSTNGCMLEKYCRQKR